nr:hypothetical protein HK105_005550 [Polyrhizophydium stewartii]
MNPHVDSHVVCVLAPRHNDADDGDVAKSNGENDGYFGFPRVFWTRARQASASSMVAMSVQASPVLRRPKRNPMRPSASQKWTGQHPWWTALAPDRDRVLLKILQLMAAVVISIGLAARFGQYYMIPSQETLIFSSRPITSRFSGWGTSLAWWAEFVGRTSPEMRAQILDLVFDQSSNASLKLNIVRFNIGGSTGMNRHGESVDDEGFRSWGAIPSFIMPDGTYNWNADTAQVVVLQEAKARGANVFEAFSNSPPWWMTVSNTTRGAYYGTIDNIRPENYPAFAEYLATVVAHARDAWGITFDYLEPFNEPNSGWWKPEVSSQEGCEWSAKSQAAFIPFLVDAVRKAGLLPRLKASQYYSYLQWMAEFNLQNGGWIEGVGKINVHGYA